MTSRLPHLPARHRIVAKLIVVLATALPACSLLLSTDELAGGDPAPDPNKPETSSETGSIDATPNPSETSTDGGVGPVDASEREDAGGELLAEDAFERSDGPLGSAPRGGGWSVSGSGAWSIAAGRATVVAANGKEPATFLPAVTALDLDVTVDFVVPNGIDGNGTYYRSTPRFISGKGNYRATVRAKTGSVFTMTLSVYPTGGTEKMLGSVDLPFSAAPGTVVRVRGQVVGQNPTTLRGSAWRADEPEPSTWVLVATDDTPVLQAPGSPGMMVYVSSSATGGPFTLEFDNLVARGTAQ